MCNAKNPSQNVKIPKRQNAEKPKCQSINMSKCQHSKVPNKKLWMSNAECQLRNTKCPMPKCLNTKIPKFQTPNGHFVKFSNCQNATNKPNAKTANTTSTSKKNKQNEENSKQTIFLLLFLFLSRKVRTVVSQSTDVYQPVHTIHILLLVCTIFT